MDELELVESVAYVSSKDEEKIEASSDNQTILKAYHKSRARTFLDDLLIPLVRKQVKEERKQDAASSMETNGLFAGLLGTVAQEKAAKRLVN